MDDLMVLIDREREKLELSPEEFANKAGMRGASYYRQRSEGRSLGVKAIRGYYEFFKNHGNKEVMQALVRYAIGDDNVSIALNGEKNPS